MVKERRKCQRGESGEIIVAISGKSCCTIQNRRLASGLRAKRPSIADQLTFLPLSFFSFVRFPFASIDVSNRERSKARGRSCLPVKRVATCSDVRRGINCRIRRATRFFSFRFSRCKCVLDVATQSYSSRRNYVSFL